ncbi:MAG: glycine/betaine ABC transporter [Chloroflexi bacterium]|nr:MAG: glycine/betaine ABC transporter [Chloroflexota bacterium]PIE80276.1 MAG: glycine/betaine ABC transporter [Chloroflexota bacterium]
MIELLQEILLYAQSHVNELLNALGDHLLMVGVALGLSLIVSVPLGVWTSRSHTASVTVINFFNGLRVIPSIAILFLAIPYFGLSFTSAIIALTILAFPPILINTDAAYRAIDPAIKESAAGMGMTKKQTLWRVETPLALPIIVAGIRTAAVEVIASATLAAFIGIGGLGLYVVRGFALYDISILLVGAIPVAGLALSTDLLLGGVQRWLQPPS